MLTNGGTGLGLPSVSSLLATFAFNIQKWGNRKIKVLCATLIKNSFLNKYCDIYYILFCPFYLLQCPFIPGTSPGTVWEWCNAVYKGGSGRTHFHLLQLSGDRCRELQKNTESNKVKGPWIQSEYFPTVPWLVCSCSRQADKYKPPPAFEQRSISSIIAANLWLLDGSTVSIRSYLFVSSTPFLKEGLKSRPLGQI